jgi:inward rectifier potassium channel
MTLRQARWLGRSQVQLSYSFRVIGSRRGGFRDAYHALLKMPWWDAIGLIVAAYLVLNALFALVYLAIGGVANAAPSSFLDAFFFSVQTMGTIGYGTMFPITRLANFVVVGESIVSLLFTALATGIIFVRFSQTRGRILFSKCAVISPMDGVPTLMIRVGNERRNAIYDAQLHLTLIRTRRTAEGQLFYLNDDLKLARQRAPTLMQSWTMLHRIDETSPLKGATPESLASMDAELSVALSGIDDTSLLPVHGRHTYEHFSIYWGARLVDVLTESPDGNLLLDLTHFHEVEPTQPTADFPYPRAAPSVSSC